MNSLFEVNCPACDATNQLDNGDVSDMTISDVEDFECWKCGKGWSLDDEGTPSDEIDDAATTGKRPANERIPGSVVVKFDNDKAASHFMSWLDGQGEQDYWIWMECREQKEKGNITATNFKYNNFEVIGSCGRLDKQS